MAKDIPDIKSLLKAAAERFKNEFEVEPVVAACAPGRVNLIGEHTDYNDGFVLPMALPLVTVMVGKVTADNMIRLVTCNPYVDEPFKVEFERNKNLTPGLPKWANYFKGVVALFPHKIPGFNAVVASSVPTGGGLSSSASIEVCTHTFLEIISNLKCPGNPTKKALTCQKAEHEFAGMPCGIMDQFISTMGKQGNAILIDCRTHSSTLIPIGDPTIVVLVTNSNVKHELSGSEYPTRRAQCFKAAELLGLKSLRDASLEDLPKLESIAEPVVVQRARHVIGEITRTLSAAEALKTHDYTKFGQLMVESHTSLKIDYEVSCPELDALVDAAMEIDGVLGSRMTGGGFGGCTVTLVKTDAVAAVIENIKSKYSGQPDFYVCVASDGAKPLSLVDIK